MPTNYTPIAQNELVSESAPTFNSRLDQLDSAIVDKVSMSATSLQGLAGPLEGTFYEKGAGVFNVKAFGAVGDGLTDDTLAIQAAINAAKGHALQTIGAGTVPWGYGRVVFPAGKYRTTAPLVCDKSVSLEGAAFFSAAVINAEHAGNVIVVHGTALTNAQATNEDVRAWRMANLAIHTGLTDKTATCGVLLGAKTFRAIELEGVTISGINGYAVYMGESVYFPKFAACEIKDCDAGIYAGHYCDMVTVSDRCFFTLNRGPDLVLACPTFYVHGCTFENSADQSCHIEIRQDSAVPAANRNGLITGCRFGPEGKTPAEYDIEFTRGNTSTAAFSSSGVRIIGNTFFSPPSGTVVEGVAVPQKLAPIAVTSPVANLVIQANTYSNYASGRQVSTRDVTQVLVSGTNTATNDVDDVLSVKPELRGLFGKFGTPHMRQVVSAGPIAAMTAQYAFSWSTLATGQTIKSATLAASTGGTNYDRYIGIAVDPVAVGERHTVIATPGATIASTLNTAGSTFWAPVYFDTSGGLTLTPPTNAKIVARVLTVGANAQLLVVQ